MSTERDPLWDALKAHAKDKFDADRAKFHADALAGDDGLWTKHSEWHWSRSINGKRLDYWPSRKRYQFDGRVMRGDVRAFIAKLTGAAA